MVKKKRGGKKWEKYTEKKKEKTIVIGYAYLSQGKHITGDVDRKEEGDRKDGTRNLVNQTGQIRRVRNGSGAGKQDRNGGDSVDGWVDSKNEFALFSFCERQFSTLTSYWCTTWVDNMNANKIRKEKH